ncbi:MAG: hypothetical protein ACKV2T_17395 [Kofleriaceae bacterium]
MRLKDKARAKAERRAARKLQPSRGVPIEADPLPPDHQGSAGPTTTSTTPSPAIPAAGTR